MTLPVVHDLSMVTILVDKQTREMKYDGSSKQVYTCFPNMPEVVHTCTYMKKSGGPEQVRQVFQVHNAGVIMFSHKRMCV